MELVKKRGFSAEAIGKALLLRHGRQRFLVVSDFHLGFEESLNDRGALINRFQFPEIRDELLKVIETAGTPDAVVIAGDLKHDFGRISGQEWKESLELIDFLSEHSKRLIIVRGNHDTRLGKIANLRSIQISDYLRIGRILILHGHKLPELEAMRGANTIIMGHEHPAIPISDGIRTELFKCFLIGRVGRFEVIVLPSFSSTSEGTDVSSSNFMSPILKGVDIKRFRAVVCGPGLSNYEFGSISHLVP